MSDAEVITIRISGPTQSGKSSILATIKETLEAHELCVAIPDREERNNPSKNLRIAEKHEQPNRDTTVVVLSESVNNG